jgi:hypothetical protein
MTCGAFVLRNALLQIPVGKRQEKQRMENAKSGHPAAGISK